MRYHLLGFVPLLAMTHNALAQPVTAPSIAQPTTCISTNSVQAVINTGKQAPVRVVPGLMVI